MPLTGLTADQIRPVCALTRRLLRPASGRPRGRPMPVRVLLLPIHLRINLTTRALEALLGTNQSGVDPIIHHLVPVLASTLRPAADTSNHPWIIDATLIPVHDQSAHRRRVVLAGKCWPGNRNDVIVARATLAHLLTATRQDSTGPIIRDHRYRTHRRIRARIEHVIARLKDCQTLQQCRRRGDAISHTLQIIAGLWNLKTHTQLRVKS